MGLNNENYDSRDRCKAFALGLYVGPFPREVETKTSDEERIDRSIESELV
jgi:hypothetical protein